MKTDPRVSRKVMAAKIAAGEPGYRAALDRSPLFEVVDEIVVVDRVGALVDDLLVEASATAITMFRSGRPVAARNVLLHAERLATDFMET